MSTTVILIKVEERRVQLQHREESFLGIEVSRSNVDIHLPAAVGEVGVESEEVRRHTLKVAPRPIQWAAKMPSWPQLLECAKVGLSGTGFRIAPPTAMRRSRALPTARHLHLLLFGVTAHDGRMTRCSIHSLHARFAGVLRVQAGKEAKQCEPARVHIPALHPAAQRRRSGSARACVRPVPTRHALRYHRSSTKGDCETPSRPKRYRTGKKTPGFGKKDSGNGNLY